MLLLSRLGGRAGAASAAAGTSRFDRSLLIAAKFSSVRDSNTSGGGMDQTREQQAKEYDDVKGLRRISEEIIPHLLNLYRSSATAEDFEIYAPDATFEDPLMCAHGVNQIKSAFYSLRKVFSESKIVEYTIQENAIAPGKGEIFIDNRQHYKILGKEIDLTSLITLQIVEGKVVRHEDWWEKKPLRNRETVRLPLLGRLAEITRRGSMLATHAMMGFGKDPSPSGT